MAFFSSGQSSTFQAVTSQQASVQQQQSVGPDLRKVRRRQCLLHVTPKTFTLMCQTKKVRCCLAETDVQLFCILFSKVCQRNIALHLFVCMLTDFKISMLLVKLLAVFIVSYSFCKVH